ncbi:hypothetical protein AAT19DRAFT_10997 [Rhodotorula toruloides]|uniref:Uncharacterized protein n=1 Tax=Rhodotorula toruloides TaxID=5286 RepID=A0A2S9ZYK9_RHOTO|nr:hypothetical protein AAT19DRAFT_10997 [Rhodotorula toruloides]
MVSQTPRTNRPFEAVLGTEAVLLKCNSGVHGLTQQLDSGVEKEEQQAPTLVARSSHTHQLRPESPRIRSPLVRVVPQPRLRLLERLDGCRTAEPVEGLVRLRVEFGEDVGDVGCGLLSRHGGSDGTVGRGRPRRGGGRRVVIGKVLRRGDDLVEPAFAAATSHAAGKSAQDLPSRADALQQVAVLGLAVFDDAKSSDCKAAISSAGSG